MNLGSCSEFTEFMEIEETPQQSVFAPLTLRIKYSIQIKWKSQLFMQTAVFATCLQADSPH